MPDTHPYLVPDFVAAKIKALNPPKSLLQIATEAGFRRLETLSHVITGDIALPMNRVRQLAEAIDCPVQELTKLALKDWRLEQLAEPVAAASGLTALSAEEHELIAILRAHRGSARLIVNDAVRAWIMAFPDAL